MKEKLEEKCFWEGTKKECSECDGKGSNKEREDVKYSCYQTTKDYYERMMEQK